MAARPGLTRQERYRRLYAWLRPGWRHSVEVYRDTVDRLVGAETRVLDVGCGHSVVLREVFTRTPHTWGADPEAEALARNDAVRHRIVARAEALPFEDGAFDLVVCAWVLEHLEDPEEVFREIARVLRPGGRFVFLTPNAWNYNVWIIRLIPNRLHELFTRRLYGRQERDTFPVRYRANTLPRLRTLLGRAGFREVETALNGDPTYIALTGPLFGLARVIERALETRPLGAARVHLIGTYERRGVYAAAAGPDDSGDPAAA